MMQILPWQPPSLSTQRLLLRPITLADAPAIFAYASNPMISRYLPWQPHQDIQDSLKFIEEEIFASYAKEEPTLGICLKEDTGCIIGTISCRLLDPHRFPHVRELAYALAEDQWGQGIVREAAHCLISWVLDHYPDVLRIEAKTLAVNLGSARVMQKLGMQFEGSARAKILHKDAYLDMEYYAILRDEFLKHARTQS